jgi:purine-binding chemotaxis protein CheW
VRTVAGLQAVVFALCGDEFAVDVVHVREIDRMARITRVPRVPPYVEGIINLRGQLVPVVDLRKRLGMPHADATKSSRIVVAEIGGRSVGMIVDEVREVVRIPADQIAPSESVLEGLATEYVGALAKAGSRVIVILDLQRVLAGVPSGRSEAPGDDADKGR